MTPPSAKNHYGIFFSKKARNLASKYNLPLNNKNAYIHNGKYITYIEVKFIIENLWLDHFMFNSPKPINVTDEEYQFIQLSLEHNFPNIQHS